MKRTPGLGRVMSLLHDWFVNSTKLILPHHITSKRSISTPFSTASRTLQSREGGKCQGSMLFFLVCHLFPCSYVTFPHLSPLLAFFPTFVAAIYRFFHTCHSFSHACLTMCVFSHGCHFCTYHFPTLMPPLYISRYIIITSLRLGAHLYEPYAGKDPPQSFLSGSFLA